MEEWRKVAEFNGAYLISNTGKLKSVERDIEWNGTLRHQEDRIMSEVINKKGYVEYQITYNGKHYSRKAHRLVAMAFIPNPDNKPYINHKDGIKTNNNVENLEWCTNQENVIHAYENELVFSIKAILQFTPEGHFVRRWKNAAEITRELGIGKTTIHAACKRKNHLTKGFIWRYEQDKYLEQIQADVKLHELVLAQFFD